MNQGTRLTQAERLYVILSDGDWHSTKELARKVSHRFAGAKHELVHRHGYRVEKRSHPRRKRQWQYRITG